MRLSPTERLILLNQYEILNRLDAGSYEDHIKVLRTGYEFEIEDRLFNQIDEVGLSKDECIEVIDVLAMYDHLINSFERLADKQGLTEFDVRFRGFDAAESAEGRQLGYALHLVEDQGRFKTKVDELKRYEPMLPRYRKALTLWEQAKEHHRSIGDTWLSAEEIREVTAPISKRS